MTPEEQAAHKAEVKARLQARKQEAAAKKAKKQEALQTGQKVVIDLDFEGLMTQPEISSICHQLMFSFSANSKAEVPCHLHFTSVTGEVGDAIRQQISGFHNWQATRSEQPYIELLCGQRDKLVYLSADSPDELTDLDPQDIYIIGGLVDRNRHKNICYERAVSQGIRTARLPIGGGIQLSSSAVLTVNHVVEIMLEYLAKRDWQAALDKVVPLRKRAGQDSTVQQDGGCKRQKLM